MKNRRGNIVYSLLYVLFNLLLGIHIYCCAEVVSVRKNGEVFDAKITNIKVIEGRHSYIIFNFEHKGKQCSTYYGYSGVKVGDVIKMRRDITQRKNPSLFRDLMTKFQSCMKIREPGMDLFVPSYCKIYREIAIIVFCSLFLLILLLAILIGVVDSVKKLIKLNE